MNEPLLGALPAFAAACAVGYGIFRLAAPRNPPTSAGALARRWFAWVAFASTLTMFPKLLYQPFSVNNLAVWLIVGLAVFGGMAFLAGWLYGKVRFRALKATSSPSSET